MSLDEYKVDKLEGGQKKIIYADILKGVDSSWSVVEKAKYVYDKICEVSTYDARFIFSKDPELLNAIYNRQVDIFKPTDSRLICKTLNIIYSQLLNELKIKNDIISSPSSVNKHIKADNIALIFYDEMGRSYFTNVAADLQRSKYRMKTQFFCGCDENYLDAKRERVTILKEDELRDIDLKTGHLKKEGIYSDEIFEMIASEVKHNHAFRKTLKDLPQLVREYLGSIGVENASNLSDSEIQKYIEEFEADDLIQLKIMALNYLPHNDSTYGAIENKKHSIALFSSVFDRGQIKRITNYDMVKRNGDEYEIINVLKVSLKEGTVYYLYSQEKHRYEFLPIEQALVIQRDYILSNNKNGPLVERE